MRPSAVKCHDGSAPPLGQMQRRANAKEGNSNRADTSTGKVRSSQEKSLLCAVCDFCAPVSELLVAPGSRRSGDDGKYHAYRNGALRNYWLRSRVGGTHMRANEFIYSVIVILYSVLPATSYVPSLFSAAKKMK